MDDTGQAVTIRVMVFNIERGGTGVDFAKVVEAIRLADPDIVALEEAMGNTARVAAALGWHFSSARTHVLSRYPTLEPAGADGAYEYVEVGPGRVVAIANVHLPAEPYGPALLTSGSDLSEVAELERRVRLPRLEPALAAVRSLAADAIPVFVLGDFNTPLDFDLPVQAALRAADLRDTWREVHRDPLAVPGLTWPAARPAVGRDDPRPGARQDRIDGIYATGPSATLDSRIVGETGAPDVEIPVAPWPSDHRAVVATFQVWPAPMAAAVLAREADAHAIGTVTAIRTTQPVYREGEPIEVAWTAGPGNRWDWVAVYRAGEIGPDRELIWAHTGRQTTGRRQLDAGSALVDQSSVGGRWPLAPGDYEVAYLLDDSDEHVARARFTITG